MTFDEYDRLHTAILTEPPTDWEMSSMIGYRMWQADRRENLAALDRVYLRPVHEAARQRILDRRSRARDIIARASCALPLVAALALYVWRGL